MSAPFLCPLCGKPLGEEPGGLRCPAGHSFDRAKEGYVNLLPVQKKRAKNPGDSREMVAARRAFLQAGHYAAFQQALSELCVEYAPGETPHILDAGCGEGSYDAALMQAMKAAGKSPALIGFDLSRAAVRLAARLVPRGSYCVASSFHVPVESGWADLILNVFSPMAREEFLRLLRPGGVLIYATPTARHLFGLKEVLYETPYENREQAVEYSGFTLEECRRVERVITVPAEELNSLFAMTPYFWRTPAEGARALEKQDGLKTEIGFCFYLYRKSAMN